MPEGEPSRGRERLDFYVVRAIDQAADLVFVTDKQDRFIYANRRSIDLLGYLPADLVGGTLVSIVEPDDHALVLDALRTARLEEPRQPQALRISLVPRHAEATVQCELLLRAVVIKREVVGCIGIARTVTEQQDYELQASERAAAIRDLANQAADRINNPLAVLVTHLGIIARAAGEGRPAASDSLAQMRNAIERIADVTRDLATVSDTSMHKLLGGRPIIDLGRSQLKFDVQQQQVPEEGTPN
ncbi:MAG: PAS domain-containing protein [Candidatus Zipacnadales bacterium]